MKYFKKRFIVRAIQELYKELLFCYPAKRPKRILFDHLPKCGGSTVSVYLQKNYPIRKSYSIPGRKPSVSVGIFKNMSGKKRYGYNLVKGHLALELLDSVHPETLKVTVLREPIDRIISHYYYAKGNKGHYLYSTIKKTEMNLEEYASIDNPELRNWYTCHFSGLSLENAELNPEKAISRAFDVLVGDFDIVGFLDNFSSFMDIIEKKAGFRHKYNNRKVNVTQQKPKINNVPQSAIYKIEQLNQLDIILYEKIRNTINEQL